MKSMRFKPYGGLEQMRLVNAPPPAPAQGQILVEVAATSVNPVDWKLRSGMLRWITGMAGLPGIPCFDFAGQVKGLGGEVADFAVGDRVFGMLSMRRLGAATEHLVVDAADAALLPASLDYKSAAGIPLAGMTALQALRDQGGLAVGHRALIIGASGGVGHYGVQIAKAMGAHVTGVCGSQNVELVRSLGANEIINYTRADAGTVGEPFDVILDSVMSLPFARWRPHLSNRGVFVSLLPKPDHLLRAWTLPLHSQQRLRFTAVRPNRRDLGFLGDLAEQGKLKTVIDSVHPLEDLAAAMQKSQSGRARGKIIVSVID